MIGVLLRGGKLGQRHTGRVSHIEVGGNKTDASNKPRIPSNHQKQKLRRGKEGLLPLWSSKRHGPDITMI